MSETRIAHTGMAEASLGGNASSVAMPPVWSEMDLMVESYSQVTAEGALGAYLFVRDNQSFFNVGRSKSEIDKFKEEVDGAATSPFENRLNNIPFRTISVGSEGDKEAEKTGSAAPSAKGEYGPKGAPEKDKISDVVEGTTATSRLRPGGSSTLTISRRHGLRPITPGDNYIMRLSGPPNANGVMDYSLSIEENIDRLADRFRMPKSGITLAMLEASGKRAPFNAPIIEGAKRTGATVLELEAGDLLPGILSVLPPELHGKGVFIGAGRTGKEENSEVAAAAKIMGGFMQVKEYSEDPQTLEQNPVHGVDFLVPGGAHETLVSLTAITPDRWLDIPHIKDERSAITTNTWVLSSNGVRVMEQVHYIR